MTGILNHGSIPPEIAMAINRGIDLSREIKAIEKKEIDHRKDELDGIKKRIQKEMVKNNIKQYSTNKGSARWVFNKRKDDLDEKEIMKALNMTTLAKFQIEGKRYDFVRLFPKK